MAISTSVNGDIRTVTLGYSGDNTKVLALLTDAAQWIYTVKHQFPIIIPDILLGERPALWSELTNQQKLSIIDQAVRADLLKAARNWHLYIELPLEQEAIENEAEILYEL